MEINVSEEKKRKLQRLFGVYLPQACGLIFAIDPALNVKPWLYNITDVTACIFLSIVLLVQVKLCDGYKDYFLAIYDCRSNWCVWLFISCIGLLISFTIEDHAVISWIVAVFLDIVFLMLPEDKLLKKRLDKIK